ncbi:TVP38/TMEM64 family protein [Halovenus sp. HT40]|uniref:TVP38/TMEM64 family protein n=1 Tax=Halovenus sp. HT40 TaxID=3126691 RepID=UPI00300F56E9
MGVATRRQLLGLAGLVSVAGLAAVVFSPGAVLGGLEELAARPLIFGVALGALYLVRPFLLWPVTSVAVLLGYLYGPAAGFGLAIAGAALTALPPYLIGRYANDDIGLFGYVSDTAEQFFSATGDVRGVVAARFSPVPGDPISYAAGLSGLSAGPFLLGTMIGEVPWAFVAVFAGASMRTLDLSSFSIQPELVVALAGLAVLLLAGPAYRRVQSGSSPESQ